MDNIGMILITIALFGAIILFSVTLQKGCTEIGDKYHEVRVEENIKQKDKITCLEKCMERKDKVLVDACQKICEEKYKHDVDDFINKMVK